MSYLKGLSSRAALVFLVPVFAFFMSAGIILDIVFYIPCYILGLPTFFLVDFFSEGGYEICKKLRERDMEQKRIGANLKAKGK